MSKFLHTMVRISSIDETLRFFSLLGFKEVSRYDKSRVGLHWYLLHPKRTTLKH